MSANRRLTQSGNSQRVVHIGRRRCGDAMMDRMTPDEPHPDEQADIPPEWLAEFEAAARRDLRTRFRYSFIHTYKPVLDDEPFRAFDTTADYRRWCEENLP